MCLFTSVQEDGIVPPWRVAQANRAICHIAYLLSYLAG